MNYTEIWDVLTREEIAELFKTTLILTKLIIWMIIIAMISWFILDAIMLYKKKNFIKNLNEHDKAVITDYKNIKLIERKKHEKH